MKNDQNPPQKNWKFYRKKTGFMNDKSYCKYQRKAKSRSPGPRLSEHGPTPGLPVSAKSYCNKIGKFLACLPFSSSSLLLNVKIFLAINYYYFNQTS
jgi:hypothetical protein